MPKIKCPLKAGFFFVASQQDLNQNRGRGAEHSAGKTFVSEDPKWAKQIRG
jgi:hypothetical protein